MKSKEQMVEEFRVATIRDAAMRVIARKGVTGASMQEIADEAGVAKGTLYLYFRNQHELLEAAIDAALTGLLEALRRSLETPGTFEDRLRLLVRTHLEFLDTHRDLFEVHISTKYPEGADPSNTRCDRAARPQYQMYLDQLTAFLSEAMERKEIRRGDPRRVALFMEEGMVAVILQRLSETPPPDVDEDAEWITTMILTGISNSRKRSRA